MVYLIDKATRDKTTQCPNSFKCLIEGGCPGCEFQDVITNECIIVKTKPENKDCHYSVTFGGAYVCTCPTRCEIHLKYGK